MSNTEINTSPSSSNFVPRVDVPADVVARWENDTVIAQHNLHESPLFDDEGLIELIDRTARDHLYALSMGTDLTRPDENLLALHEHLDGRQLLDAVKAGRLWLNITRIHEHAAAHSSVADDLYAQLANRIPGFEPTITTLTLLISSPQAMVYYHVDGPANLLWHIRGEKTIWIYPPEEQFVSQVDLEDIFASVSHEYIDYDPGFDARATEVPLTPGMLAGWRPNSPHRVTNGNSFNVSLSTEHYTPHQRTKARVYQANRLLRTKLGRSSLATSTSGPVAAAKQATFAVARRTGQLPATSSKQHVPALRVDPDAPNGVVPL